MQNKTSRTLGIVTGIIALIAVIAIASFFYIKKDLAKPPGKSVVKPILADEMKNLVVSASDSLYHLEFSFFDVNTDSGTAIIKNLKLIPDSTIYQRLALAKKAPNSMMTLSLDSAVITHFAIEKAGDKKKLVIDDIILQNPSLLINFTRQPYSDSININSEKTLLTTLKNLMKLSSVSSLTMHNLNLTMINHSGKQLRSTSLHHLNITTNSINVTTLTSNDSSHRERTAITIGSSRIATPDSLYYLTTEDIRYVPESSAIAIKKTELLPRLSKELFYKKAKFRKDRYHFIQNNMVCNCVDVDKLIRQQQIHIRSISIGSSYAEIYTDYDYPKRTPPVRNHGDPHERLQKLAFDITIDTMHLHNGITEYAIKGEKSDDVAVLKMDKLENTITNITNNDDAKERNHFTTSTMTGRLMDGGVITSTLRFNLTDKNGAFTISNHIGAMDGKLFNPLIKPLALMEIQSLNVQKMNATISGNAYAAKGNIDFYYKDMKIALVKKRDDDTTYKKKKLISFVSNLFVPDNNPNKRGKFKKGPINVQRNPHDSFFGFLWKCNLQGMAVHMTGLDKK